MKRFLIGLILLAVATVAAAGDKHCVVAMFWDDNETGGVRVEIENWNALAKLRPGPEHMRAGAAGPNADKYLKVWVFGPDATGFQYGLNQWTEPEVLSIGVTGAASSDVRVTSTTVSPADAERDTFGGSGAWVYGTQLATADGLDRHHSGHEVTFYNVWNYLTTAERAAYYEDRIAQADTLFAALDRPIICQ